MAYNHTEYMRQWTAKHRTRLQAYRREWRANHQQHIRDYARNYYAIDRARFRRYGWKQQGMDPDEAERVYQASNVCAVCEIPVRGKNKVLDHDHETGQVRAVLCQGCNRAVALVRESPDVAFRMGRYLERLMKE
jgi:hypothetical protein